MKDCLYIIVPAYNEEENIEKLVQDWYPVVQEMKNPDSRLVIINDGSKDQTYEILRQLAQTRPRLLPLTKPNGGHGPTLLYGYQYAIVHHADWIFQTDSDGQTDPKEFWDFWARRTETVAVFGNRQKSRQDGVSRKFVETTLCILLRWIFGVRIPDANAPFRLMKTDLVQRYLGKMPTDYNLPNVMLTTYCVYFHEKIAFIPVTFKPRQGGVNSINIRKIVKIGWKALSDFREMKKHIDDGISVE